jgi:type II secretory pathway pseudopilin PulG
MTQRLREARKNDQRGMALIATLMLITVFLILVGALMENLAREVNITGMHGRSNAALRADYYALEQMQYQIEFNDAGAAPGVVPAPINGTFNDEDGTVTNWSVNVDAYRWTNSVLPYYLLHATATAGASSRSVDALVQKMPFSAFNYFTISEQNNHNTPVVYTNGESFDGPVYSGGPMNIFYTDAQPAIFTNEVWTANAPNWIPAAPSTAADWSAIITDKANFHQVSQPLQLPTAQDNNAVLNASLTGNPAPAVPPIVPAVAGLYINGASVVGGGGALNSGLFIKGSAVITSTVVGNVDTMQVQISNGGPPIQYNIVIDTVGNTTTINSGTPSFTPIASFSGIPSGQQPPGMSGANGAIYATGSMQFSSGNVFHGQYTFTVPDSAANHPDMFFFGSQTYADSNNDEMAFWANDIVLADGAPGNIEVDGLLLTGYYGECSAVCNDGTFYNSLCPAVGTCGGGSGVLTLKGSLIENVRGKRGTLGSTISGYSTDSIYDSRLATKPPPFTPTTTQYNIIAVCTTDSGTTCGQ